MKKITYCCAIALAMLSMSSCSDEEVFDFEKTKENLRGEWVLDAPTGNVVEITSLAIDKNIIMLVENKSDTTYYKWDGINNDKHSIDLYKISGTSYTSVPWKHEFELNGNNLNWGNESFLYSYSKTNTSFTFKIIDGRVRYVKQ